MTRTTERKPRYRVVGGKKGRSDWYYLDERELRGYRIYLMLGKDGTQLYGADFRLRGQVLREYMYIPLEAKDRTTAWREARKRVTEITLPAP